jgi:hypothetical protein
MQEEREQRSRHFNMAVQKGEGGSRLFQETVYKRMERIEKERFPKKNKGRREVTMDQHMGSDIPRTRTHRYFEQEAGKSIQNVSRINGRVGNANSNK